MFSHDLSRALLAFHGHFFVICHGHFLVHFSDESGNPFIKKKVPVTIFESPIFEKCHGQFTAFTGTFSKSFTGNQKLSRGKKQTLILVKIIDSLEAQIQVETCTKLPIQLYFSEKSCVTF